MDAVLPAVGMEELQAKYQRLGQEYQKARAQITVLKKAVLDEQASNKVLQEGLKQRDLTVRKHEQEIDSLHFRNSQFSKRIEILQNELCKYDSKGVKPAKQSNTQTSISFIHEQELQMKIAENESLHKQLQEVNAEYETKVRLLESRLELLEKNREDYEKAIGDCNSKNDTIVQKLKEEQLILDAKLNKQSEDLKFANIMSEKCKDQFKEAQIELRSQLENTTELVQEKMPFIDSEKVELNKFNIPICDRAHRHEIQSIIELLTNHFIAFLGSLSDYHTYLEQRLQVFSIDIKQEEISSINVKFSSHLLKNALHSRRVQHSLKSLHEQSKKETFITVDTLTSLGLVLSALQSYSKYLNQLIPYRILSIEEECCSSTWSESLEKSSKSILYEERRIVSLFQMLASYFKVASIPDLPAESHTACMNKIDYCLMCLNDCFKNLCEHYVSKTADEHQYPTYTDRLKTTDDFLLSTVYSLESSSSKLYNVFNENLTFLGTSHVYKRKGIPLGCSQGFPSNIGMLSEKATRYIESLIKPAALSVPYSVAVGNHTSLISSPNADKSTEQIIASRETIVKLEQEKEHWVLEYKLLKAKYNKVHKKVSAQEELKNCQVETLVRPVSTDVSSDICIPLENNFPYQHNEPSSPAELPLQRLGTVEVFSRSKSGSTDSDQESLVKEYLSKRISELTKHLQLADSKCVSFYQEAHSLYKQLILADKNKQKLTNKLMISKKEIESLQDELETTKRSYEEQLGMFSDHLCGMNDKLSSQKDQIDELKTVGVGAPHKSGIFQLPSRKK